VDDLRRILLDTSAELIATEGLAALSMREVARRAGVSHQAPYHHFGDREAILAALCDEGFRGLVEAFERAVQGVDGAEDRLAATGDAYLRWALGHPAHYRVMFRPELVALERFPDTQEVARRAWQVFADRVAELVEAGRLRADQAEAAALLVWSSVHGLATLLLDGPPPARSADPVALGRSALHVLGELLARPSA
jgi:AcrR family transcriptional regulator